MMEYVAELFRLTVYFACWSGILYYFLHCLRHKINLGASTLIFSVLLNAPTLLLLTEWQTMFVVFIGVNILGWLPFIYYLLHCIKNRVEDIVSVIVLTILLFIAMVGVPLAIHIVALGE